MKAQIRRWSNEENKNYFVAVDVMASASGQIYVKLDGIALVGGYSDVESAMTAAEQIIRNCKISNS